MSTSTRDWTKIRAEYEGSPAPLRVIGGRHGVSHEAIRKHAKAEGWQRAATGLQSQSTVADEQSPVGNRSPKEILEDIAASALAPAAARVRACEILLRIYRQDNKPSDQEKHDRVTTRALELIQGGRR